ncbi:protein grpE [Candidatus Endolissoclinum faulkneri L5]|uniref:Protein GrpE n=1 Tax=Candidatus Endolissoclinum faulkneri L5 TaxID=1401328 RepID=V9TVV5_9PROT|nr:nucleotide exchange factor GrpE [Candidatus Endolissoclinum faulkneri]AHC73833.1 protein grpE [Candidatus Endolissoclinum faulkneri L5]
MVKNTKNKKMSAQKSSDEERTPADYLQDKIVDKLINEEFNVKEEDIIESEEDIIESNEQEDTVASNNIEEDPQAIRIANLEQQLAKFKDQALRALAEAENLRRRTEREKEQWRRLASADLAKDLLNAVDNLRRAIDAMPTDRELLEDSIKNVIIGVEMTEKEILSVFDKHNIKQINPLGEKFDYNIHQAMFEVEDVSKPLGTIVQVLAPGYVLHDRLLRAALVGVSKTSDQGKQASESDTVASK